jgi:hypothetical protein
MGARDLEPHMPLLPGGDDERVPRWMQLLFAAAALWLGYQGFLNVNRYNAIASNLSTLADELNIGGEEAFRREFVRILDVNSVTVDPSAIEISIDAAADDYVVRVPFAWSLDLHWWHPQLATTLRGRVRRVHYGG